MAKIYFRFINQRAVHFLSHYYLDKQLHNPYFVTGALLPDILPHFTKTYNDSIRKKTWVFDEPIRSLHSGILRHYELDALFHASGTFKEMCHQASELFMRAGLDRNKFRLWFVSHIAVEVLLDRQLLLQETRLTEEYYSLLEQVEISKLEQYLKSVASAEHVNMGVNHFLRFKEVKFLYYLSKIEGAAEGIMRTVHKATGIVFSETDKAKLLTALHNIDLEIRYKSEKLIDL